MSTKRDACLHGSRQGGGRAVRAGCARRSRWPREARAALALVAASLALSLLAGESRAAQPERPSDVPPDSPYVEFYMGEVLVRGWVIAVDWEAETFHFYDAMARAQISNVPLAQLPPTDTSRLRKWTGEDAAEGGPAGIRPADVELIEATRYIFKNGREIVGLELPELSTEKNIYARRRNIPLFPVPRDQLERSERVKVPVTDIYSPEELYRGWREEIDPESGSDHYELAEHLRRIGHWVAAYDHYRRAMLLDPRIETQAKERLAELDVIIRTQVVDKLDREIQGHCRADRCREALETIERLGILGRQSRAYLKWMGKTEEIEKRLLHNLRREVVGSYYRKMDELIRKWAWGSVVDGESIIGKIVVTRNGVFKGRLIKEDENTITLEMGGREIRIDKAIIIGTPKAVELNPKRRDATFGESQAYVTDTEGGLTGEIMSALVKQYSKMIIAYKASQGREETDGWDDPAGEAPVADDIFGPPETAGETPGEVLGVRVEAVPHGEVRGEIKAYWEGRLKDVVTITLRGRERTPPAATQHEASWGIGTWLRPDIEPVAVAGDAEAPDPEKWWESFKNAREVRYQLLRAMAAEALCKVDREIKADCSNCGRRGFVTTHSVAGQLSKNVCPMCKGVGVVLKIKYR